MREKQLKWACIGVFICIVALMLLGFTVKPEETIVKELLEKRTDIMENVLSGKISYAEGKEQLKEVEGDKLYSDDLENMQKYQETNIEQVEGMRIIDIEKKNQVYDMMTFHSKIYWTYYSVEGKRDETINYLVGVSNTNHEYKLISLQIQEPQQ